MSAIGYVTIGAIDGRTSGAFYDAQAETGFYATDRRDPAGNKLRIFWLA